MSFKKRVVVSSSSSTGSGSTFAFKPEQKIPTGIRLSPYNGQLLISTGVPSLDDILCGIPLGSLFLILEDRNTSYAKLLLKYFIAEGLAHENRVLVASADEKPQALVKGFPVPPSIQNKKISLDKLSSSSSIINSQQDQLPQPFCHTFDLTKRISEKTINAASLSFIDIAEFSSNEQTTSHNALRIAIQSIASPMWPISTSSQELFRFFHALRGLLRSTNHAAMMTIPAHLYIHSELGSAVSPSISFIPFIKRIARVCDAVVGIESFAGSPQTSNSIYTSQYNGLFHVHKLPTINSLLAPATKLSILSGGGGDQLGFKLRRRKFAIEKLHLPPEGGVGERRTVAGGGGSEVENAHKSLKKFDKGDDATDNDINNNRNSSIIIDSHNSKPKRVIGGGINV
ncbi:8338_t:CDS:2 [Ambispora gerdemannii]|uniref:Elongator complex protein 4 n=1 Tax=Ambispora gerdemannii TaxID=144530 RepID=A0A9N8V8Y7_9GLOM|nr:8338_t:CDS:2 [Ambispora gerdemannii]